MSFPVRAITLDLDDTLWPFAPIGARIEQVLHAWMERHSPETAARFPVAEMRALRERVVAEHPQHAHDLSLLRRLTIERALRDSGGDTALVDAEHPHLAHDFTRQRLITLERMLRDAGDDVALVDAAFEAYFAARCEVEHYPDSVPALERLAARVPLAALSNGNACLTRIGLMHLFRFQLGARDHGAAKPAASIFHAACARLDVPPHAVLHVGDDVALDVVGAHHAGLRTCWINRDGHAWPRADLRPDLVFDSLAGLADWLDATHAAPAQSVA